VCVSVTFVHPTQAIDFSAIFLPLDSGSSIYAPLRGYLSNPSSCFVVLKVKRTANDLIRPDQKYFWLVVSTACLVRIIDSPLTDAHLYHCQLC